DVGAAERQVLSRNGQERSAVRVGQSEDVRGAGLDQVGAVEAGVRDHGADLSQDRGEVGVQGAAAVGVQRSVGGGQRLRLELVEQVGDRGAGRGGYVNG